MMLNERIEVLQSADKYLYNLRNGVVKLVELMQAEKEQEAILLIPEISDGITWIMNAVDLTRDIHKNEIGTSLINEHLESIIEGLENEDYILIGDIFNYEIIPILDKVHDEIRIAIAN